MNPTKVYAAATGDTASTAVVADGSRVMLTIEGTAADIDPIKIDTFPGLNLRLNRAAGQIALQWKADDTLDTWRDFADTDLTWAWTAGVAVTAWFREG